MKKKDLKLRFAERKVIQKKLKKSQKLKKFPNHNYLLVIYFYYIVILNSVLIPLI